MRRQRNMARMKEQNKTPEKKLDKMEISNLTDADARNSVSTLQQHKKSQAEMKYIRVEMNKLTGNQQ